MLERGDNKEYLPIEGLAEFRKATIDLMLGPNSKAAQEVSRRQLHGGLRRGCERHPHARRNSNDARRNSNALEGVVPLHLGQLARAIRSRARLCMRCQHHLHRRHTGAFM